MLPQEILLKVGVEATVGPALSAVVSSIVQKSKARRKCSTYYTLLLHGPPAIKDEIAELGVEEGCWTESFVKTLRSVNGVQKVSHKDPSEIIADALESTVTDPSTAADIVTGQVDDALASAVRRANMELLETTLQK